MKYMCKEEKWLASTGKRMTRENVNITLRGNFLAEEYFKPIQLALRLEDDKGTLKRKKMENVSSHLPTFLKRQATP